VEEKGLTVETADKIGTFVKERGPPLELLSKLKREDSKFLEHEGSVNALNDLDILFKALDKSECIDKVVFDLSLARGLDYYTGVIFEAIFKGGTQVIFLETAYFSIAFVLFSMRMCNIRLHFQS
jgi:histidyl-tRNA synthetase